MQWLCHICKTALLPSAGPQILPPPSSAEFSKHQKWGLIQALRLGLVPGPYPQHLGQLCTSLFTAQRSCLTEAESSPGLGV